MKSLIFKHKKKWIFAIGFSIITIFIISSKLLLFQTTNGPDKGLNVGVFLPEETQEEYSQAIELAIDEINNDGGVLGQKLSAVKYIEPARFLEDISRNLNYELNGAHLFAYDKKNIGVVNLTRSPGVIAVTPVLYDKNKIHISAAATDTTINKMGYDNLFSTQISDKDTVGAIVKHARDKKLAKFVIFADDSIIAKNIIEKFEAELADKGGGVLLRTTSHHSRESFEKAILYMIENDTFSLEDVDAVFIAAQSPIEYIYAIKRLRELNVYQPIYAPRNMISNLTLEELTRNKIDEVYIITPYNRDFPSVQAINFLNKYKNKFKVLPTFSSEEVYTGIKLLAYCINQVKSSNSKLVSTYMRAMRYTEPFQSPSGKVVFDVNGRITDTDIFILEFDGMNFSKSTRYLIPLQDSALDKDKETVDLMNLFH